MMEKEKKAMAKRSTDAIITQQVRYIKRSDNIMEKGMVVGRPVELRGGTMEVTSTSSSIPESHYIDWESATSPFLALG